MTGNELVEYLRESVLDDVALPYLWSATELLRFLNYAEVQACRRANLLIDATTANDNGTAATAGTAGQKPLTSLTIVANQATYALSPKILQIKRCQLQSMSYPLDGPLSYPELDERMSGWRGTNGTVGTAGSGGVPYGFLNEPPNTITFILAPSTSDVANLVVSRIPLSPFTLQTSPEIDEQYHVGLCDWAAHLAYMKPDSETLNLNLSKMYEDKFIQQFGPLPTATAQRMRKQFNQKQRMRPMVFGA
jgi:hypothetical protein